MGGRLSFPGGGHYHATKHALEAISDALRFELRGFGIDVILLEPGLITTEFGEAATASMAGQRAASGGRRTGSLRALQHDRRRGHQRRLRGSDAACSAAGPDRVAKVIERAIARATAAGADHDHALRPSSRSRRGACSPTASWDAVMRRQFPQPQ